MCGDFLVYGAPVKNLGINDQDPRPRPDEIFGPKRARYNGGQKRQHPNSPDRLQSQHFLFLPSILALCTRFIINLVPPNAYTVSKTWINRPRLLNKVRKVMHFSQGDVNSCIWGDVHQTRQFLLTTLVEAVEQNTDNDLLCFSLFSKTHLFSK